MSGHAVALGSFFYQENEAGRVLLDYLNMCIQPVPPGLVNLYWG